jgi:hypothetical protein
LFSLLSHDGSKLILMQVSATLTHQFSNISKNKQKSGMKMESVCKLCCQADNFKTLGTTDSSLVAYILFENCKLKIATNRPQFIL